MHDGDEAGRFLVGDVSTTRRAFLGGGSAAALAALVLGAAPARGAMQGRSRALGGGVVIFVNGFQVSVEQLDGDEPLILVEVVPVDSPGDPVYSSIHSGTLTDEMIAIMEEIGELDLGKPDFKHFNSFLKKFGLEELQLPEGDPTAGGGGYAGGFVLILVLFILLVIIGAGFGLGYGDQ